MYGGDWAGPPHATGGPAHATGPASRGEPRPTLSSQGLRDDAGVTASSQRDGSRGHRVSRGGIDEALVPRYFEQIGKDVKRSRAYESIQELQLMVRVTAYPARAYCCCCCCFAERP
jgi:hypothetical protein